MMPCKDRCSGRHGLPGRGNPESDSVMRAGLAGKLRSATSAAILAVLGATGSAPAASAKDAPQPTAAGLWERVDSSGAPAAWFRVLDCGGIFQGKMVRIFSHDGQNPAEWRCTACTGDQQNAPVIGLTFIKGMKRNGLAYEGGSILDPRTGSVYGARMDVSPDGQQLSVRGFLGIELLGHTEVWRRLPDSAMPAGRSGACS
jgi:uncharacterized protein (DUF2147 family)